MKKMDFSLRNIAMWAVVLLVAVSLCACSSMEQKRDKFQASGKEYFQKQDYVKARLQFQNALQIDPKFAEAYLWLGKTELKLRNPRGAYGNFSKAVELNPNLTEAQILLGDILLVARQLDKAQEKAEIALKQEPKNSDAMMLAASLALARKQPQKALEWLAKIQQTDPAKATSYLMESLILASEKKPDEAAARLEAGIKAAPKAINLYVTRAHLADQQEQFDTGESFLLKALALEPKNVKLQGEMVRHYGLAKQWGKAEQSIRKYASLEPDSEKPVIMLAQFLASQGRRQEAEKTLNDFIKAHPKNFPTRFGLAAFYVSQRRLGEAEKALKDIIQQDPEGPQGIRAQNELARLMLTQGHMDEAEKLVSAILKEHPKDLVANETRGIIALNKKDGLTAVNCFRLITQDQPKNPQAMLLLARAYLLNKEPEQAKESAKKAVEIKPDFLDARRFLYGMYLQNKDYDGLINLIQGYLNFNDKDIFNLISLGEVNIIKGNDAQAQATFQRIIDLAPKDPRGYYQMALLGLKTKKPEDALKYAGQALQVNPDFIPALQLLVGIYHDQKQPDKALAAVRQDLARNPKNPQLQQLLGEMLLLLKRPEAAIAPLEEALHLNPRQVGALRLLAVAYLQMPDSAKALQQLEAKVADPKSNPILSLVLATVYEKQQNYDKAIGLYNRLLAHNLFPALARNNLAYLMADHQPTPENLNRAHKLASESLADNPEEPSFLDTMGWVLCKQGNYVQAKEYLEKALEHAPKQSAMLYHLGWCEAKLGDTAAARQALEKAMESKTAFAERDEAQKLLDSLPAPKK